MVPEIHFFKYVHIYNNWFELDVRGSTPHAKGISLLTTDDILYRILAYLPGYSGILKGMDIQNMSAEWYHLPYI